MTAKNSNQDFDGFSNEMLEKIGARIKTLRKREGYSNYEKFANKFNLSRSQVGKYEKGGNMNMTSLLKILHSLGISLGEFFGEGFD